LKFSTLKKILKLHKMHILRLWCIMYNCCSRHYQVNTLYIAYQMEQTFCAEFL